MEPFVITPKVEETQEFIEIANDFSNPLDLVRESISNSYDAKATEIKIIFEVAQEFGESVLKISLKDNGTGMNREQLQNFFDLGNSSRRGDTNSIGEKGHGTKIYFNSRKIEVITSTGIVAYRAVMDEPFRNLHNRIIPTVKVECLEPSTIDKGTEIKISGYNNNRRSKFTHKILKDYIGWFTKHGAIDTQFLQESIKTKLFLKGLGHHTQEEVIRGHYFPKDSNDIDKLFEAHLTRAPDFYSKKITKTGVLKNHPEVEYHAVFCIEGRNKKYEYNEMLRRSGYVAPEGAYTVQERYGLWICKDYIPIQRKNEWITIKGSEYTKFHAFINCQGLRLTANRGSIDNTPSEILQDLKEAAREIFEDIITGESWTAMEWLEDEAEAYQTTEKEQKNFAWRIKKINRSNVATYNGISLVEPERESGVFSIFLILSQVEPSLFPFYVVDYDTHEGIDVIAKGDNTTPMASAKLYYVEFKRYLSNGFNHTFENLHSVVCWETNIMHDDTLRDVNRKERIMRIVPPKDPKDYTRYFLDDPRAAHRIEVFVLKQYLREKLGIEFNPRPANAVI